MQKASTFLEVSITAVEMTIEHDEDVALDWLNRETKDIDDLLTIHN